jgi:hypothetical protein
MSRFTTLTATNATINNLSTDIVNTTSGTGEVNLINDINMNSQSIHGVNAVDFGTFELIEDVDARTLGVHIVGTRFKGALYDSTINRPYEQTLPVTQRYTLPADYVLMINNIIKYPSYLYNIECEENYTIDLPALTPTNQFQNTHLRFSNSSNFLINFTYAGSNIIQIGYERASFLWRTEDGINYTWVYVP